MSAQKITASRKKLDLWQAIAERDHKAHEIAEREGCSFSAAVARVLDEEESDAG